MIRGGRFAARLGLAALAIGAASAAVGLALERRGESVAAADPARFDADYRDLAAAYAERKYALWATGSTLRWGALAGIVALGGGFALAALARRGTRGRPLPATFGTAVLLLAALALVALPVTYASGHATERAFGLSTQGASGWFADWARRQAFWIPIYAALLTGFLWAIDRWPRRGWAVAAGAGIVLVVLGAFVAPRVIDPLFHDFHPLEDEALREEVVALGAAAGIDVERVLVMDASRRTRRLNAYVTGLGATRQVVLYDTLLESAPPDEVRLVVAHEIAHAAERHVPRGLLWSIPGIVLGAWGLAALARLQAREDPALDGPADPAGIPLLWLGVSLALFLTAPVASAVSRGMEAEADRIALDLTGDPDTYVRVQERLAGENLAPITPPGWLVFWLWSHPPVLERIAAAERWAERHAAESDAPEPDASPGAGDGGGGAP